MVSLFMKFIKVSGKTFNDKKIIVDDELFEYLNQFKWYSSCRGYAYRYSKEINGKQKKPRIHREIMKDEINNSVNKGLVVDHINKNKLDNRRINLRLVTQSINCLNRRKSKNNTSGYIGVSINRTKSKIKKDGSYTYWTSWIATVGINHKQKRIGYFKTAKEASVARQKYLINNNLL